MHRLVPLPSTASQKFSYPEARVSGIRSPRTCRRLQESQASPTEVACHKGLPVTDILQSILLGAKFLSTYCARKWEPLPPKQVLRLTSLMSVYRHGPQSKEGGGLPFLSAPPIKLPAVRTHFLGPSGSGRTSS